MQCTTHTHTHTGRLAHTCMYVYIYIYICMYIYILYIHHVLYICMYSRIFNIFLLIVVSQVPLSIDPGHVHPKGILLAGVLHGFRGSQDVSQERSAESVWSPHFRREACEKTPCNLDLRRKVGLRNLTKAFSGRQKKGGQKVEGIQ